VEVKQTLLVCVSLDTCQKLNHTAELANLLKNLYSHSTLADPAYTITEFGISRCKLGNICHKIVDALKTAQLHHLSMDLISPEDIKEIFDATTGPPKIG
jgi:hypothetical protein